MNAQQIDPTVKELVKALKACAKEECGGCYLRQFSKDGFMSTGETCFAHLALDAAEKLMELNDFENSQCAKLLAENGRLAERFLQPLEVQGDAAQSSMLALELSECKQELERLKGKTG